MTTDIIRVQGLSRDFTIPSQKNQAWWQSLLGATKTVRALDGASFGVAGGERVALLGHNGSGKSTLLKLLTGVIHPTSGHATVLSHVPWSRNHAYLRRIGVMFGQKSLLLPDLTVMDALKLYGVIYGLSEDQLRQSLSDLDDFLRFGKLLDRPARKLSLGERMRCEVAAALLHRPDVIFLDEPTIGMDADVREGLARYLEQRIGPEQTLIFTTHEFGLARRLCTRAMVMADGSIVRDLPLQPGSIEYVRIDIRYRQVVDPVVLGLTMDEVRVLNRQEGAIALECAATQQERVRRRLAQAVDVITLTTAEASLDTFLEHHAAAVEPGSASIGG